MLYEYDCSNRFNFAKDYIKLHEIKNVVVAENSLMIKKENKFSIVTLPKNEDTLIKILDNAKK